MSLSSRFLRGSHTFNWELKHVQFLDRWRAYLNFTNLAAISFLIFSLLSRQRRKIYRSSNLTISWLTCDFWWVYPWTSSFSIKLCSESLLKHYWSTLEDCRSQGHRLGGTYWQLFEVGNSSGYEHRWIHSCSLASDLRSKSKTQVL